MIYIISISISGILVMLKQKRQTLFALSLVVVLWWLMTNVSEFHSFDTSAYQYMYSYLPSTHRFERGYMTMSYFFYTHGYSYTQFRGFYFGFFLSVLFIAVRRFTKNVLTFFFIFAIFPFFVEITQVRNFAMISIVILGISFLKNKGIYNWIIGTTLISLGSLFQVSGLLFLLIPLAIMINFDMLWRFMPWFYGGATILSIFIHYFLPKTFFALLITKVFSIIGRTDSTDAASLYSQGSSFVVVILYIIVALLMLYAWRLMASKNPEFMKRRDSQILFSALVIAGTAILLMSGSSDYERYIRDTFTIILISFSIYEDKYVESYKQIGCYWLLMFVWLLITSFAWGYWNTSSNGRAQFMPYLIHLYDIGS